VISDKIKSMPRSMPRSMPQTLNFSIRRTFPISIANLVLL